MRDGWIEDRFENCLKLKSGDGLTAKNMKAGQYPVYGGNGIAGYHDQFNLSGTYVIIGRVGALCGIARCIDSEIWLTDNAFKVSETNYEFDHHFLTYLLNYVNLRTYARQAAQPVISNSSLKNVTLSFPKSLPEQKQIVSILDRAFAAIDQAKANLERNIENAKELFQSKLNEIFSQQGEGWEEKRLGDLSKIMYGHTAKTDDNARVHYLRITDIQDGKVDWNSVPKIEISQVELPKYKLGCGDIVFARTGATTGKSFLIDDCPEAVFASYLIRVQCDKERLLPNFLYLFFQSGIYWEIVANGISGSAQGGFNASKLSEMIIHFPTSKKDQQSIVEELKSYLLRIEEIITKYQLKLSSLEELKKSILQQAFSGELTKLSASGLTGLEDEQDLGVAAEPEESYNEKSVTRN
ncbi:restriction endonuclease subunit S [Ekhidna sp.]|jgi:type I restriction enzyme S subunit|uniref:restriction endonuclease subunit S n=1 Tax=Ekhidna sp. TaxID=2608089 RepID=UPI0032EE7049